MDGPVLEVAGVTVARGGRQVLHGVSLTVEPGGITALLGPNGAGKTTLMDAIMGQVPLASGRVRVKGTDIRDDPRACRRRIGYAGQEVAVFPPLTVLENVSAWAAMSGVGTQPRAQAVDDVLQVLFLSHLTDRPVRTLSGGEQRRVHCAMSMVGRPEVLLLDEPTVGVDPTTRTALLDHIDQLAAAGVAVLYSTHYLHEVERRAADVVMLQQGGVIARGSAEALISHYCTSVIQARVRRGDEVEHLTQPTSDPAGDLVQLLGHVQASGGSVVSLEVRTPTLEDAFAAVMAEGEACGAA